MRTSILSAVLFTALAVASPAPQIEKRERLVGRAVVTDLKIVTVTDYVTEGAEPTHAHGSKVWYHRQSLSVAPAAPAPTSESSSYVAPAPPSSSAPAPSPVAAAEPTTPAAAAPAPAQTSASSGYTPSGGSDYQSQVVDAHNVHRANHSSPALTWDDNLAGIAAEIAATCVYAHDVSKGTYGQNIAAGTPANQISDVINNQYYNEELPNFMTILGNPNPDFNSQFGCATSACNTQWGHLTQVIWKATTSVGCATQDCTGRLTGEGITSDVPPYFTVCNYASPGNYAGEFATNCGPPLGQPVVT
jgi:hypothetical protein